MIGAMAAVLASWPASADDPPPVARGVLAGNKLAQAFEVAPPNLPDISVTGPNGDRNIHDVLQGRIVLMPIWAEWCAPCLTELPDFARLQQVYGKGKFAIVPVLSGTKRRMTPDVTAELLASLNAQIFEPLIEARYGADLVAAMGAQGGHFALPCNVLIGADGRVIAREMGLKSNHEEDSDPDRKLTPAEAMERIAKAARGETQSLWGTAAGDEFAAAMAGGFFQ